MISIQDLGLQILGNAPKCLYILGGSEYGVKEKYIEHLSNLYNSHVECQSFDEILQQMKRKHIVPIPPSLYVVRYDEKFLSDISENYASDIRKAKISGTVICLYDTEKAISKFDKYIPEFTASIDAVNPKFISKYLHQDFPKLDDRSISIAVNNTSSYGHAKTICRSMNNANLAKLASMPEIEVASMFGCNEVSSEQQIQAGVASRNFSLLISLLDKYEQDADRVVYTILQTMIELDKIQCSKYSDSPLKQYCKLWTREDIYYMFMNAYSELRKLRSMSSYNSEDSLVYLFGLLKFQRIPSPEVMEE